MRKTWLVAAASLTGCIVVPHFETKTVPTGREVRPVVAGAPGKIVVRSDVEGIELVVRAARQRECKQDAIERFDEVRHGSAKLEMSSGGGGGDGRGLLLLPLVEPPLLAVSGIITGIIVAVGSKTTHHEKMTTARFSCPTPVAGVAIEVALPSGAVVMGATDEGGRAAFAIPDAEPVTGDVIVRAGSGSATRHYDRAQAECVADRAARFARAMAATPFDRVRQLEALPSCGDRRAYAWSILGTASRAAVLGRCTIAANAARRLGTIDEQLYRMAFERDSELVRCAVPASARVGETSPRSAHSARPS
jgi:hypothetical protein